MALPHTKTSGAARTAVIYITLGAVTDVWSILWLIWMRSHPPASDGPNFWCWGFLLTGLTLILIGLGLGQIGRAARHAEAPVDVTNSNAPAGVRQAMPQPAIPGMAGSPSAPMPLPAAPAGATVPATPPQAVSGAAGTFQPR